jgi:hypothetical protein
MLERMRRAARQGVVTVMMVMGGYRALPASLTDITHMAEH